MNFKGNQCGHGKDVLETISCRYIHIAPLKFKLFSRPPGCIRIDEETSQVTSMQHYPLPPCFLGCPCWHCELQQQRPAHSRPLAASSSTASSRALMEGMSVRGRATQSLSKREPVGVCVWSSRCRREPEITPGGGPVGIVRHCVGG